MNLIEKLGLEKCKQIVDGAPEWAQGFCFELSVYAASSKGVKLDITCLDDLRSALADHDLRSALADHDRIDTCSDIRNHISPNTKVIEHESNKNTV
ncbi:hypothetical protein [Acinetobacter lwoffii]|uniref:hypothetical protein n=1 Tax=Acinetobacter lwoffii TaxID=28090 RepID=UPI0035BC20C5|nr:hypothetical protein ABEDC_1028 [Acinetobacter lwoffii]